VDQQSNGEKPTDVAQKGPRFPAFQYYNYRLYWGGQSVSLIGTWLQTMAQAWLVLELSDSAFILGLVGTLQFLPIFLFSLFAGVLVDRFPKRRILIFTQASSGVLALTLGFLTLTGVVQVWHIMILAFLLGTINSFDMPTRHAFVSEMVDKKHVLNAVALSSLVFNAARVVGPAIGGVLIAQVGIAACFLINGVSYIAAVTGLLLMDPKRLQHFKHGTSGGMWADIREGLGYIRHTRVVAVTIAIVGVVSLFGMNFNTLNPLFAREVLHTIEQEDLAVSPSLRSAKKVAPTVQLTLFEAAPHPVMEKLKALDPDTLSPIEALLLLKELREGL
jgi:MFS family permease